MVNPLSKLQPNRKLGPFPRKYWMIGGVTLLAGGYYLHRRRMANVAGPTDPTVAGATQDANGNQVQTGGTATDAGTTPMSAYDPYTSGYNGYGYDLTLGTGGIVRAPVGQNGTDAGNVVPPAVPPANPAAPGAVASGPQQVTVNYQSAPPTKTVKPPSNAQRDTHRRKVREGAHNMKNGRKHDHKYRQTHHHSPQVDSEL